MRDEKEPGGQALRSGAHVALPPDCVAVKSILQSSGGKHVGELRPPEWQLSGTDERPFVADYCSLDRQVPTHSGGLSLTEADARRSAETGNEQGELELMQIPGVSAVSCDTLSDVRISLHSF